LIATLLYGQLSLAQESVFEQTMKVPLGKSKPATALAIAQRFVGQPYKAHTLEQARDAGLSPAVSTKSNRLPYQAHTLEQMPERLICNLTQFDCYTFVESVLALTQTRYGSKQYVAYQKTIQKLRYRNGQIDGYASRLHYFLEWIVQSQKNDFIEDITSKIPDNELFNNRIDFMTKHRKLYPQLSDSLVFESIRQSEHKLNQLKKYYLPKSKINEAYINDGDIIGITSNTAGLDFNHEGFAIKHNGRIHLLHASSDLKKVIISKEPLIDYLAKIKKHSGIVVLRLVP
jgi:hypothetical protein